MSDTPNEGAPKEDKGADRETRFKPCTKKTWCIREEGHPNQCEVVNRPLPVVNK